MFANLYYVVGGLFVFSIGLYSYFAHLLSQDLKLGTIPTHTQK